MAHLTKKKPPGYIDVGDGCWRRNVLETTLRCWFEMSPISKFCHQHPKIVTNIKSPTSTRHQHLCSPHKVLPNFCRVISQYRGCCEKMSGFKSSSISPLHNRLKTLYIRGYFRLCFGHFILVHRMIRLNKGS